MKFAIAWNHHTRAYELSLGRFASFDAASDTALDQAENPESENYLASWVIVQLER